MKRSIGAISDIPEAFHEEAKKLMTQYNNLTIGQLREVAKQMCIPSSTTLKKEQLLSVVVSRCIGDLMGDRYHSVVAISNELKLEFVRLYREGISYGNCIGGILIINTDYDGFLWDGEREIFVAEGIIKDADLREGDMVEGVCKDIRGVLGLISVNTINSTCFKRRAVFDELASEAVNINDRVEASNKMDIAKGQRAFVFTNGDPSEPISEMKSKTNITVLGIQADVDSRCCPTMQLSSTEAVIPYGTSVANSDSAARIITSRAMRLAEMGKDVLLMVSNIDALSDDMSNYIFSRARKFSKGSISVIAITNSEISVRLKRMADTFITY